MFQTVVVTHAGGRGRPAHPREHERRVEAILDAKGKELGEVSLEAGKGGSVVLTAVVNGKEQTITFPGKRPSKAKATVAARKARKRSSE